VASYEIGEKECYDVDDSVLRTSIPLYYKGLHWRMVLKASPELMEDKKNSASWIALILGISFTALFTALFAIKTIQASNFKSLLNERTLDLKRSNYKYKTLLESLPQCLFYKNANLEFESCNHNFASSHNLDPCEVIGKTDYDFYPKDMAEKFRADDRAILAFGRPMDIEEEGLIGGKKALVHVSKTPFKDEYGNSIGILGLFWDITDLKKAEERIRTSEERLSMALAASNSGLWDWNISEGTFYYSPGFYEMLGYDVMDWNEASSHAWRNFVYPDDADKIFALAEDCFLKKVDQLAVDCRMKTKSGEWRWISCKGKVFDDVKKDSPVRIVGTATDVSKQRLAAQEREQLISKLESKNAELERFTYTVSHDLKSPLITIKGFLGFLAKDIEEQNYARIKEDIERIAQASDKMYHLLDDLLALSRIGRFVNPPQEFEYTEVVKEALDMVEGSLKQSNAKVEVKENLPILYGDKVRIREVMQNLLENAIKYSRAVDHPVIEIGVESSVDKYICYVQDNGIGIDPRYHEKIFDLFSQLDNSSEGAGVGLALVKRIIELHEGKIWVESKGVGFGSKFCFYIPSKRERSGIA
jgi:PAS domain S-box-containing protein